MSGSLKISEHSGWSPASWIFTNALGDVANGIERHNPDLARDLRRELEASILYYDISNWTSKDIGWFLEAALAAREQRRRAGAKSFHDPSFFPVFMKRLDDLIESVQSDERVRRASPRGGHQPGGMYPPQ